MWTADGEDGKTITLTLTAEADPYVAPHIEVTITQDMSGDPLAFAYLDGDAAQTLGEWADTLGRMA